MAKNSDIDILLSAQLDIKTSTENIKGNVKDLSTKFSAYTSKENSVLLSSRLDTSNVEEIKKDIITISNKLKNGNKDGSVMLKTRINLDDTADLIKDINNLSKKLKGTPLSLQVSVKDSDMTKLKDEMAKMQKAMSGVSSSGASSKSGSTSGMSQDIEKVSQATKQLDIDTRGLGGTIAKVVRHYDTINNGKLDKWISQTTTINQGVGRTVEILESTQVKYNQITNQAMAQNDVYKRLNTLAREEYQLKDQMAKSRGEVTTQLQAMLDKNSKMQIMTKQEIADDITMLSNKSKELELEQLILNLKDQQMLKQAKIRQSEKERVASLGTKVNGNTGLDGVDFGNIRSVNEYVQSLKGAGLEVTNVTTAHSKYRAGISDTSKKIYEVTAIQKLSNNQMKEHKFMADENSNSMYKFGESMKPLPNKLMGIVRQMGEAIIKSAQWGISMRLLYGNIRKLKEGIKVVKDLDKELTAVATTLGQSRQETKAYADTIVQTAINLRRSVSDVSAVNTELVRQGLSLAEAKNRMDVIMKLSSVGGMDSNESLKVITSSVNALGEDA